MTDWKATLARAVSIVGQYDTGVTLRQLFYRLVADGTLPNTNGAYKRLSAVTAQARRKGSFPALVDNVRQIRRPRSFDGPEEARAWLAGIYRRDRTEGQEWTVYLGVEKAGIVQQLWSWFSEYGLPILALGGYSSQTYADQVAEDAYDEGRPAVLLYSGDFDPSGEDIERDFVERAGCFEKVIRVALNWEQVQEYELPPQMGKATDSRASAFRARHGRLVQVELDALPPDVLRGLFTEALEEFWDMSTFEDSRAREMAERRDLETSHG